MNDKAVLCRLGNEWLPLQIGRPRTGLPMVLFLLPSSLNGMFPAQLGECPNTEGGIEPQTVLLL